MIPTILATSIVAATIIVTGSIFMSQQMEADNDFQILKEEFTGMDWNNEITRILPTDNDLEKDWTLLWSDGTKEYVEGQTP